MYFQNTSEQNENFILITESYYILQAHLHGWLILSSNTCVYAESSHLFFLLVFDPSLYSSIIARLIF